MAQKGNLANTWLTFTLGEWTNNTGNTSPSTLIDNVLVTSNPVPEPAALGMLIGGSALLILKRKF